MNPLQFAYQLHRQFWREENSLPGSATYQRVEDGMNASQDSATANAAIAHGDAGVGR